MLRYPFDKYAHLLRAAAAYFRVGQVLLSPFRQSVRAASNRGLPRPYAALGERRITAWPPWVYGDLGVDVK